MGAFNRSGRISFRMIYNIPQNDMENENLLDYLDSEQADAN